MMANSKNALTVEEFEEKVVEEFNLRCEELMRDILKNIFPKKYVDDNVKYYLTGEGCERWTKGAGDEEDGEAGVSSKVTDEIYKATMKAVERLHETYKVSKKLYRTAYVFLNAPHDRMHATLDEDTMVNRVANNNMYAILHPDPKDRKFYPKEHHVVKTEEDIQWVLHRVFRKILSKTMCVFIVFNGDGWTGKGKYPKGSLYLCGQKDRPLTMQKFKDDILEAWTSATKEAALNSPKQASPETTFRVLADADSNREVLAHLQHTGGVIPKKGNVMEWKDDGPGDTPGESDKAGDLPQSMDTSTVNDQHTDMATASLSDTGVELMYENILETIPPLPNNVTVAFAQCYSHEFEGTLKEASPWGSTFEMLPLTKSNVRDGEAGVKVLFNGGRLKGGRSVHFAQHEELEELAKQIKENRIPLSEYGQQYVD